MKNQVFKTMSIAAVLAGNLLLGACGTEPVESSTGAAEARAAQMAAHQEAKELFANNDVNLIEKTDVNCNAGGKVSAQCKGNFSNCSAEAGAYINCSW